MAFAQNYLAAHLGIKVMDVSSGFQDRINRMPYWRVGDMFYTCHHPLSNWTLLRRPKEATSDWSSVASGLDVIIYVCGAPPLPNDTSVRRQKPKVMARKRIGFHRYAPSR